MFETVALNRCAALRLTILASLRPQKTRAGIEVSPRRGEQQMDSYLTNRKATRALTELGFKIQREHFGEFRRHGRASVWRSRSDHGQKTLYRFHDDVGNEKRFLV